jgi:hypothetical protein
VACDFSPILKDVFGTTVCYFIGTEIGEFTSHNLSFYISGSR